MAVFRIYVYVYIHLVCNDRLDSPDIARKRKPFITPPSMLSKEEKMRTTPENKWSITAPSENKKLCNATNSFITLTLNQDSFKNQKQGIYDVIVFVGAAAALSMPSDVDHVLF